MHSKASSVELMVLEGTVTWSGSCCRADGFGGYRGLVWLAWTSRGEGWRDGASRQNRDHRKGNHKMCSLPAYLSTNTTTTMPDCGCPAQCFKIGRRRKCTEHPGGFCDRHCSVCKEAREEKAGIARKKAAAAPAELLEHQSAARRGSRGGSSSASSMIGGAEDQKKPADASASRKGGKASASAHQQSQPPGPMLTGGTIDMPLGPVSARLSCPLCHGYFREPYTIAECLHTFCKRCLLLTFAKGSKDCPTCHVNLAPDPYRECLVDRTLESIVDKLFPELKGADEEAEKEFYEKRGIKLKRQFREVASSDDEGEGREEGTRAAKRRKRKQAESVSPTQPKRNEMNFRLLPDDTVDADHSLPRLDMTSIRASDHLKISQIKKYLMMKLHLADRRGIPASAIEICCNGGTVGDELSLTFIERTRWMQAGKEMVLTYRKRQESMFG